MHMSVSKWNMLIYKATMCIRFVLHILQNILAATIQVKSNKHLSFFLIMKILDF